jgi:hypothetical protein
MMNLNSDDLEALVQEVASDIMPSEYQLTPLQFESIMATLQNVNGRLLVTFNNITKFSFHSLFN